MPEWQRKLAQLTDAMGPIGDAVFAEIVDSVLEAIDKAHQAGVAAGSADCICGEYAD